MGDYEFYGLFYSNIGIYFLCLVISFIPIVWILQKVYRTIIDPLFYAVVMTGFSNTVPLFLFVTNKIDANYFAYFVLAETLFWVFLLKTRRLKLPVNKKIITKEYNVTMVVYVCVFSILFVLTLFTYIRFGVPAFSNGRNETFVGSGGWGAISHFTPFFTFYSIFYSFYLLWKKNMRGLAIIVLISIAIFCVLSGSRSSLLSFIYAYFLFYAFYLRKNFSKKMSRMLIAIAVGGALLIFSFTASQSGLLGSIYAMGMRVVGNGDVYWLAYPNNMITQVDASPWYIDMFYSPLYTLRILDYADSKPLIGYQLVVLNDPARATLSAIGANIRPPIYGFYHFGWFGIIFSACLGCFLSFLAFNMHRILPRGILGAIIGAYIYQQSLALIADPPLGVAFLFDAILGIGFVLCLITLLSIISIKISNSKYEKDIIDTRK